MYISRGNLLKVTTQSADPSALLGGEGAALKQLVSGAGDLKTKRSYPSTGFYTLIYWGS